MLQRFPLDTIPSSHETSSKVAEDAEGRTCPPVPEEADSKPVSGPKAGRMSFTLNSTMESVSEVEAAAEKLATEAGLDEEERFHVTMAVREAAVNAVLHGNEYDPAKQITVSFENTGKALVIYHRRPGQGSRPGDAARPAGPGKPFARHRPRHLPYPFLHG